MAPQMRKRDKKKEKAKAEAAMKKRKELYVDVKLGSGAADTGKRGAGRRQRVSLHFWSKESLEDASYASISARRLCS